MKNHEKRIRWTKDYCAGERDSIQIMGERAFFRKPFKKLIRYVIESSLNQVLAIGYQSQKC